MPKRIYDYYGQKNVSGGLIHAARIHSGMSQRALAGKLQEKGVDVTQDCISRIERGQRFVTDYELMVIAKVLGVHVGCFVGEEEFKFTPPQFAQAGRPFPPPFENGG